MNTTRRTLARAALGVAFLFLASLAQGAGVTISDVIYGPDPSTFATGQLQISWPAFVAGDGHFVPSGSKIVAIGASGIFTTVLEPNDTITPAGTLYTVQYRIQGGPSPFPIEYWSCPTSVTPITIPQCRTTTVAQPSGIVNITQLSPVGATGTCPVSNGTTYVVTTCGSTGAGASLQAVTFSATPTFDGANGAVKTFTMTLTGNVTSCTLQNFTAGQLVNFELTQDGTGSRTFNCAGATGLGTVSGVALKLDSQPFYASSTTTLQAYGTMWCVTCSGAILLPGSSSGTATIQPTAVAGGTQTIPNLTGFFGVILASGAKTLNTTLVPTGGCTTAQTASATGTLTTDVILATVNADPTGTTGYAPLTSGLLHIWVYPTADNANFKVCNSTSADITPGAITINWAVIRGS